ncbi:MAG TPA: NAD(P)/FAD-dependent oxidoreductase [Bacteroidales bacterium]|nr:NAD(P)/FAD-dependent oxidoreductase [Bacteroidales bacterium]
MLLYDVIVVGAGAAGLLAAGRAGELGARVLLVERNHTAGRKLLITGKGRCNLTNTSPVSEYFKKIHPNPRFLNHAFGVFFSNDIIKLLESQGLATVEERGRRVFPAGEKSAFVVDALNKWVLRNNAEFLYGVRVKRLIMVDGVLQGLEILDGDKLIPVKGKKIIIATGGKSYPATGSTGDGYLLAQQAGHSIEPLLPALVPLETDGQIAPMLQGLSLKNVKASLWVDGKLAGEEFGEMLFTHFGLSGPIILTLSRLAVNALNKKCRVEISIDLKPALSEKILDARLMRDLNEHGRKKIINLFKLWLPAAMIDVFLILTQISEETLGHQVTGTMRRAILRHMKDFRFIINKSRSFKEAIITAGGIKTTEVHSKTMESRLLNNLYFAGEVLDLDADTGGYNLQIAWSTGWLAGQSAANSI